MLLVRARAAPGCCSPPPLSPAAPHFKHGVIKNLDMPAMTMVFRVQDPANFDRLKEGAQVRFAAEKISGALMLTKVEAAP